MTTTYKPYTIQELAEAIYEYGYSHFEFIANMNGGDCDCHLHTTMNTIMEFWEE